MAGMNTGLSAAELEALAGEIAPQATISEIQDAVDRCKRTKEKITAASIATKIKVATSESEWEKFIKASEHHSSKATGA